MKKPNVEYVNVNGEEIAYYKINNDINGNPRYVVHFLSIGVNPADYGKIPKLTKYRAKWFGGGYVFQSYHVATDLEYMINLVKRFYRNRAIKDVQNYLNPTDTFYNQS